MGRWMQAVSDDDTQILGNLGLTTLQAEVYITLARLNEATIKTISTVTKIDRANVYRVITRLQEIYLVQKILASPTVFRALPVNEGIKMLLERKEKQDKIIKTQTNALLKKYEHNKVDTPYCEGCEFALIPIGKFTQRKVDEMVNSNRITHDIIIYWRDFDAQTNDVVDRWRKLLERGIKLRIIVYLEKNQSLPRKVQLLKRYSEFQIRKTPNPPRATISLIDRDQTLVSVTPTLLSEEKPGLWTNNQGLVGILCDYFDSIWHQSKKI